jgi:aminoglycoside phosphotransferase family enzyme/predicted kinase
MIVDDQQELIDFLSTASTYGPGVEQVERIDTHSAAVFLAGGDAYKLKRAVRYDYLDFSTVERRHGFCEAEVALNRRTAPALYLGVVAVTRTAAGGLALGGDGPPVEWLVHMRRFPDDQLLDRMAARGALDVAAMAPLASSVARFHASADRRSDHGGFAGMRWVVDGNEAGLTEQGAGILDPDRSARLILDTRRALDTAAPLLEARRRGGAVRVCHGDLHLGNIVMLDGEPVPFDGVEFNDEISCIDVLYDLAFLLMDLWRLDLRRHANELFNAYLSASFADAESYRALSLLPFFLSCRSAIRAKTSATASHLQPDPPRAHVQARAARRYLAEAADMLRIQPPRLIAIGGPSGSGKSTTARLVAPTVGRTPGALVLRSDLLRKQLCGVSATTRLGDAAYSPEVSRQVYGELAERAAAALAAGQAVIADAAFLHVDERTAIERVARKASVRFTGLWLDAPRDVLVSRVGTRVGDASDADAAVVDRQLQSGAGPLAWTVVTAADAAQAVAQRVREAIEWMI